MCYYTFSVVRKLLFENPKTSSEPQTDSFAFPNSKKSIDFIEISYI